MQQSNEAARMREVSIEPRVICCSEPAEATLLRHACAVHHVWQQVDTLSEACMKHVRLRAGAITAAAVASGMCNDELQNKVGQLDFSSFLEERLAQPCLMNLLLGPDPSTYLEHPLQMIVTLLLSGQTGLFSSDDIVKWMDCTLLDSMTFSRFDSEPGLPWHLQRELKVVTSDISNKKMRVLPDDLQPAYDVDPATFAVSEAVRRSISLPFFFAPALQPHAGCPGGTSRVVDGGLMSNFPLWIFDVDRRASQRPKCPTVGFLLEEEAAKPEPSKPSASALKAALDMIETCISDPDQKYSRANPYAAGRTISIPITDISATKFALTDNDRNDLWKWGYIAAAELSRHSTSRNTCSSAASSQLL
jgi:NTE family protein